MAGTALNKLLAFLMPIAGKKILLLLGLAIVRTALSNRLARMQVADARMPHPARHAYCPFA